MDLVITYVTQYRYLALFPLAAFEGPVVSLAVGFLVSLGAVSFIPSYFVLLLGDLIPDTIYYYIGRYGNYQKVTEKYFSKSGGVFQNIKKLESLWFNHGGKTMFFSKLAYGLSTPFLVSAGLVHLPLKKFFSYAVPVTMFQYALLLSLGYFIGNSFAAATSLVTFTEIFFAVVVILIIIIYFVLSKYATKEIEKTGRNMAE